jgi:hypothetical protein
VIPPSVIAESKEQMETGLKEAVMVPSMYNFDDARLNVCPFDVYAGPPIVSVVVPIWTMSCFPSFYIALIETPSNVTVAFDGTSGYESRVSVARLVGNDGF